MKVKVKREDLDKCNDAFEVMELVCGEALKEMFGNGDRQDLPM
jgi:hypothetical protein